MYKSSITWHISSSYNQKMSEKSVVVSRLVKNQIIVKYNYLELKPRMKQI